MADLRHVAFISPEPQKLYDYYHRLYGMEQVRVSPSGSIHVIDGLFNLAFLAQQAVASETVNTHRADGHEVDQTAGIAHYGFTVERLEDVFDKLDDSLKLGETPQNGRPAEYRIVDPWGNNVDVSSHGFLGREERRTTGVRYVRVQCPDPEAGCAFYRTTFGLDEVRKSDGDTLLTDGYMALELTSEHTIERGGIQYVGFQVDDWDTLGKALAELGQELPPETGAPVMLADPEGNPYAVSRQGWI